MSSRGRFQSGNRLFCFSGTSSCRVCHNGQEDGPNPRVVFSGTISLQVPLALAGITVTIVRGTLPTDPVVYSATSTFSLSVLAPQIINFTATDFNPPVTPQLTYSAFVSSNLLGTIRVGPESFNGQLYSD